MVDQTDLGFDFTAEKNIVRNGEVIDDVQFLMYKSNACSLHLLDGGAWILFSKEGDCAFIGRNYACQDVHQCAFARSVFSQKCMNFTFFYGNMNI